MHELTIFADPLIYATIVDLLTKLVLLLCHFDSLLHIWVLLLELLFDVLSAGLQDSVVTLDHKDCLHRDHFKFVVGFSDFRRAPNTLDNERCFFFHLAAHRFLELLNLLNDVSLRVEPHHHFLLALDERPEASYFFAKHVALCLDLEVSRQVVQVLIHLCHGPRNSLSKLIPPIAALLSLDLVR